LGYQFLFQDFVEYFTLYSSYIQSIVINNIIKFETQICHNLCKSYRHKYACFNLYCFSSVLSFHHCVLFSNYCHCPLMQYSAYLHSVCVCACVCPAAVTQVSCLLPKL